MNDFTKEELKQLLAWGNVYTEFGCSWTAKLQATLLPKIQSMIDNYHEDVWDRRKIAASHLFEAESLISHAMCLLELKDKE